MLHPALEQSQEEFYVSLSLQKTDLCLYGKNHGVSPAHVAEATGLTVSQVERVLALIDSKRAAARYRHAAPMLAPPTSECGRG